MTQQTPNTGSATRIHEQVILPLPVAIRITLRGLKIRLGRSLITMSGVILGIAFLMSVLTGEGLRSGLADETRTKAEVNRLLKLVEEEIGTFQGRKLAILLSSGAENRHIRRLLEAMASQADVEGLRIFQTDSGELRSVASTPIPGLEGPSFVYLSDADEFFRDTHVLLLLDEALPRFSETDWRHYLGLMRQPVILDCCFGRYAESALLSANSKTVYTSLSYERSDEEIQRDQKRKFQQKARQIWITIVSILVTVIGISNAMLMSVTERIREIGTMKCLGALSGFVVKLFLIESLIIGVLGAFFGTVLGFVVPFVAYMLSTGVVLMFQSAPFGVLLLCGCGSTVVGTTLAIIAAIYPARVAAKMVPADALRTNV